MQFRACYRAFLFEKAIKSFNRKRDFKLNQSLIYVLIICKQLSDRCSLITASVITEKLKSLNIPLRSRQVYQYVELLEKEGFLKSKKTIYRKLETKYYLVEPELTITLANFEKHFRKTRLYSKQF
ncbi:hypothetical protein SAMN05444277_103177 [Parafilimonas terrae]|uniref:Ferric uptake regulator family protein n=1 Tax=Parafilimonas terrae TaxID=1465490 RepID=A0A1I5UAV9_9BACT|nr:hypothetical protein SAMN05444277_103177 [Parafilimonas terrae]